MPTGYTASVQDGTVTEFREFALQCARAFGALVLMRDDPVDAPIPDSFTADTSYHDDRIDEAKAELLRIETMTDADCYAAARAEREQWWADFEERKRKRDEARDRYEAMLSEVRSWEPPTEEHRGLKDFMAKQLTESIDFDCSSEYDKPGPFLDGADWRREKIRKARRDIEYHTKERKAEIERTESRNLWVKQLRQSLARD